ncbi:MAG: hypothetical protein IJW20_07360 [Clostridia bacterium]|nr:hypothetical protein [Clostridia bacterium]
MNGSERLLKMLDSKDKKSIALKETVDYLIAREDLQVKFLNEEKTIEGLENFIKEKARQHQLNGWTYITNEVVFAWAVMYFSLPNSFLKIKETKDIKIKEKTEINEKTGSNKVISLEKAKEKKDAQLSLFGGATND